MARAMEKITKDNVEEDGGGRGGVSLRRGSYVNEGEAAARAGEERAHRRTTGAASEQEEAC